MKFWQFGIQRASGNSLLIEQTIHDKIKFRGTDINVVAWKSQELNRRMKRSTNCEVGGDVEHRQISRITENCQRTINQDRNAIKIVFTKPENLEK